MEIDPSSSAPAQEGAASANFPQWVRDAFVSSSSSSSLTSTSSSSTATPFDTEGMETMTSHEQQTVEQEVLRHISDAVTSAAGPRAFDSLGRPVLLRERHIGYLTRCLGGLPGAFTSLDASRVWMIYWILHSLDLLNVAHTPEVAALFPSIVDFMRRCQAPSGGFGGGPQQMPHAASTYAAVLSLLIVGTPEAYAAIDRASLHSFYRALKAKGHGGGFAVQTGQGETDVRGTYTVLAIADLVGVLTPDLREGAADFLLACQTHEGGFGAEPGNEAHGGYTFCALAALSILGEEWRADAHALARWLCARQMAAEGGFNGRANKLVDGCYSFWQGSCFALLPDFVAGFAVTSGTGVEAQEAPTTTTMMMIDLEELPAVQHHDTVKVNDEDMLGADSDVGTILPSHSHPQLGSSDDVLMGRERLQEYVLLACQDLAGGLRDKPGKARDHYHTCYCLSGLSVAQHRRDGRVVDAGRMVGDPGVNTVAAVDPKFNIRLERVAAAREYFASLPSPA
jgi:protein farnesyltransferase subunit beta